MGLLDFSIGDIGEVLVKAREAITGKRVIDDAEMAKIDLELAKLQQAVNTGQIEINKVEAAHKSLFVAGWRPFIGWVCGLAIAYAYIGQPIFEWFVAIFDITYTRTVGEDEVVELIKAPKIDTNTLYQLVLAMLGLAGLRTYEKSKNVAREK